METVKSLTGSVEGPLRERLKMSPDRREKLDSPAEEALLQGTEAPV
jgi:hypothetical protein